MSKTTFLFDKLHAAIEHPKSLDSHSIRQAQNTLLAKRVSPILNNTVVFKMEDDFTTATIQLAFNHPDILAEFTRRVRLPFDHVFLEWNNKLAKEVMLQAFGKVDVDTIMPETTAAFCHRLDNEVVEIENISSGVAGQGDEKRVGIGAWSLRFSPDLDFPAHVGLAHELVRNKQIPIPNFYEIREPGYDHHVMVPFLWGGIPWQHKHYPEAPIQWDACKSLSRRSKLQFNRFEGDLLTEALTDNKKVTYQQAPWLGGQVLTKPRKEAVYDNLIYGMREEFGFAKIALAALALLNAKERVVVWSDPDDNRGKMFAGKRYVPRKSFRTIRLRLPLPQVMRQVRAAAFHIRRRQHSVMGHWCSSNLRGDPHCGHEYMDLDPRRKECRLCGHRIWFKPAFKRGDASLGVVSHKYEVTKR